MNIVGPKDPSEVKLLTFDFSNQVGTASLVSAIVTCLPVQGADAQASAVIAGAKAVLDSSVTQLLSAGVVNVAYVLHCTATDTAGLIHRVSASLLVSRL